MPGAISGRVALPGAGDPPAAGAMVILEDKTGVQRRLTTDAQGRFRADALPAGSYAITVLGAGGEQAIGQIEVTAGRATDAALRLEAQVGSETIVVRGLSNASERRQSADAVVVVETERAKRETADLGEVLARTEGVGVSRGGGLGSTVRLSLAGLTDDQIRLFIDGIPLELAGYPVGIADVPVNLIDRVEVYSGVMPVRFGADALGGGVNLVTDPAIPGSHGGASYQGGSFGTDRLTLNLRHLDPATGLYGRFDGFFDHARNNYPVDVQVTAADGSLVPARVDLFHDAYNAGSGAVELGAVDRPWARRFAVRGFFTGFDRQYQSDLTMERVYGDVTYAERVGGGSVRYAQPLGRGISLDAVAGYAFTHGHYRDVSTCNYDWYGRCFTENAPGEIDQNPHDQRSWEHAAFARLYGQWDLAPGHALRLSIAPTYTTRSGNNLRGDLPGIRDPLTAERDLFSMVTGLEYQCDLLGDRLENIAFIKHYLQRLSAEDPELNLFVRDDRHTQRPGFGDSLRYRFRDGLYAKASYEWATRLPRPVEVFGDNAFILPNLALVPETSHNANLGITVDDARTPLGAFDASATGFLRVADQLIAPFGASATQTYENVFGARSLGAEATAAWTSPGDHVMLDGSATYEDFRNRSPEGPYSFYNGDRVPNLPYLFGSASARFKLRDLIVRDELVLSFRSRYVHSFFRTWESAGIPSLKQTIPSQLVHSIGAAYLVRTERGTLSTTLEVSNLTDEAVFDYFGLQRPGRAFYVKTALEF